MFSFQYARGSQENLQHTLPWLPAGFPTVSQCARVVATAMYVSPESPHSE